MKKQSIKPYYFVVQGWMREELNLTGCELSLFAIVYGFSQGLNSCDISLNYLSQLTGYSKKTVISALRSLQSKEYLAIINNSSLLSNKKLRNSYQVLKLPNSVSTTPSSSVPTTLQTDFIEILKNNLKINKLNKSQLHELKTEILKEFEEYENNQREIATAKWLDD